MYIPSKLLHQNLPFVGTNTTFFQRDGTTTSYGKQSAQVSSEMQPRRILKRATRPLSKARLSTSILPLRFSTAIPNGWYITSWY